MSLSIPFGVWKPAAKDLLADLNPVTLRAGQNTVAATAIQGFTLGMGPAGSGAVPIPLDKIAVVTHVGIYAQAGAAQTVTSAELRFADSAAGTRLFVLAFRNGNGATFLSMEPLSGPVVVGPTDGLHTVVAYSAAGNPNTTYVGYHGYLLPRGNWQLA